MLASQMEGKYRLQDDEIVRASLSPTIWVSRFAHSNSFYSTDW